MRLTLPAAAVLSCLLLAASPVRAGDTVSQDQVKALTLNAVALIQRSGLDAARVILHEAGPFRHGEIYINVVNTAGVWQVYPPLPSGEGHSVLDVRDASGKPIVREIIRIASDQGEGWVRYRWLNPATKEIAPKLSFVKRVPDTDLIVYAGIYQ